jgi:hypothetical protein
VSREFLEVNEKIASAGLSGRVCHRRKKTAESIQQEVAREVEQLLRTIFTGVRKTGHLDLEAIEMLVRSARHQAGASMLTELLGLLTAVGKTFVSRPTICAQAVMKDSFRRTHNSISSTLGSRPECGAMQALVESRRTVR